MPIEKILVLDDDNLVRNTLALILRRSRYNVSTAGSLAEAEALVAKESFDLVFADVRLPDGDGQQFLGHVGTLPERPQVIMMTGYGSIESAVSCMRAGALDYLLKPFGPSQIEVLLRKLESVRQLISENRYLRESSGDGEIVGRSLAIRRLRQLITRVAPTDATILITGESGTGKEMVAREIYRLSQRREDPYLQVNCAAVSAALIESEFFGHERGAFTGATARREGRFELANRGSLLLDEVSEIPLNLQAKLLRVLQERQFERVGGNKTIKVNVRILATSNRDLLRSVEEGTFRQDLYYRLNVFPVPVPPLRERTDDIPALSEHFLRRFSRKHGARPLGFSDAAQEAMASYPWPGNVRELQNTIERAVILTENNRPVSRAALGLPPVGRVYPMIAGTSPATPQPAAAPAVPAGEAAALSAPPSSPVQFAPAPPASEEAEAEVGAELAPLEEVEKQHILSALRHTNGNRTQAASLLQISLRTLRNKLQAYRAAGLPIDEADTDTAIA